MIVKHPHQLPPPEARERAKRLVAGLEKELGAKSTWSGDDALEFKGKGFEGKVKLEDGQVSVDVQLGFLLKALSGKIEREIQTRLQKEFA